MTNQAYALFATPIGHCGIACGERGLTGVQLPERDEAATRARMGRRFPQSSEGIARSRVPTATCAAAAAPAALQVPSMLQIMELLAHVSRRLRDEWLVTFKVTMRKTVLPTPAQAASMEPHR